MKISVPNDNDIDQIQARRRDRKQRILWVLLVSLLILILPLWSCTQNPGTNQPASNQTPSPPPQAEISLRLWETASADKGEEVSLKVNPGSETAAKAYYADLQTKLATFPKTPLTESTIGDMLVYYGFPALLAKDLQFFPPAVLMDFEQLRKRVTNKDDFEKAYSGKPLLAGDILVSRMFAPKIINVRDPQSKDGVPQGGFGWRKVLRFKSRDGSAARTDGLDAFYLLFNFTSATPKFPEETDAGQIQALLVPNYPTAGKHNDIYFLVYEGLGKANPGKVGFFLEATFDLVKAVPDGKYYVPTACAQCHGTEKANQVGGKINYLDTDHWIDRTGDDFKKVSPADVLVDGEAQSYDTLRKLNTEIEKQNAAVIGANDPKFALLAVRKWLDLHKVGSPTADKHVPPLERALAEASGDPVWTASSDPNIPDSQLLPLMNQYCFRCHSSVRFHVFQKKAVMSRKGPILTRIEKGNMPQDRVLDDATKATLKQLIEKLP